jgi:hypothetical protein
MSKPTPHLRRRPSAKQQLLNWLEQVQPDLAFTFTLPRGIKADFGTGYHWVYGDPIRYSAAYDQFIRRLSRRCIKKAFRRHKTLLRNAAFIEGDGDIKRYHLHGFMRTPNEFSFEGFKTEIESVWHTSEWSMADIRIEPITGDWVRYCLKEGPEALLLGSLRF